MIHRPKTVRRLIRAVEEDRPIADLIPTERALERWRRELDLVAAVTAPTITPETAARIIETQPEMEWRIRPWRFKFLDEAQQRISDYAAAGVPSQWIRLIYDPEEEEWAIMVATETPPGRTQVA